MGLKTEVDLIMSRQERTVRRVGLGPGVPGDWSPAANFAIFDITGGPIQVTNLFGHVTAVFAGANPTPLIDYAPDGAAVAWNPLCVIAVAAAFALNALMVWDGSLTAVSGVLRESGGLGHSQGTGSVGTAATAESWVGRGMTLMPGDIRITNAGALDATGMIDWYISYIPLFPQSLVAPL